MQIRSVHKVEGAAQAQPADRKKCTIPGCGEWIEKRRLMCRDHWRQVPAPLRDDVTRTLDGWLGEGRLLLPYLVARLTAIIHVGRLNGVDVAAFETELAQKQERLAGLND
jgi:hypothetical protein